MGNGLADRSARASTDAADTNLAGRTYAIPFARVWDAAVQLASGGLRGWTAPRLDDQKGVLEARVCGLVLRYPADFVITISLDENAQTRVDLTALSRRRGGDFGVNVRRIRRFCTALDRALAAGPHQVLNVPQQESVPRAARSRP